MAPFYFLAGSVRFDSVQVHMSETVQFQRWRVMARKWRERYKARNDVPGAFAGEGVYSLSGMVIVV